MRSQAPPDVAHCREQRFIASFSDAVALRVRGAYGIAEEYIPFSMFSSRIIISIQHPDPLVDLAESLS